MHNWTKELGKTYGYYEGILNYFINFFIKMIKMIKFLLQGHLPVLVTSDLDLIQEIFIKQYSNFSARKVLEKFFSNITKLI